MQTTLPRFAPVLLLLVVLALAGRVYADKAQEIIGRWEFLEARHGSTIFKTAQGEQNLLAEFRQDGTFTEGTRSGTYLILTDTVLRLTFIDNGKKGQSKEYQIRISGDTMVTKNKDKSKFDPETTYRRVK